LPFPEINIILNTGWWWLVVWTSHGISLQDNIVDAVEKYNGMSTQPFPRIIRGLFTAKPYRLLSVFIMPISFPGKSKHPLMIRLMGYSNPFFLLR